MMRKYSMIFSDLLVRFAQSRCPISIEHPAGHSKVRGEFYDKCHLYRNRFGKEPVGGMLVVIWEQSQG